MSITGKLRVVILQVYWTSLRRGLRSSRGYHQLTLADYCTETHFCLDLPILSPRLLYLWFAAPPLHRPQNWSIRNRGTASPVGGTLPSDRCRNTNHFNLAGAAAEFLVCLTPKPTSKLLTVGFSFRRLRYTYLSYGSHSLSLFLNNHLRAPLGVLLSS